MSSPRRDIIIGTGFCQANKERTLNIILLKKIADTHRGILATVIRTEGHTYKKEGAKALFEAGDPFPVHGNIGSGCVDQEILIKGEAAYSGKKPETVKIDTRDPSDVSFGYGVFCGGVMDILLEPLFEDQKAVYRTLQDFFENPGYPPAQDPVYLQHGLTSGALTILGSHPGTLPSGGEDFFIETLHPPRTLFIFGATPLAHQVVEQLEEMNFSIHIIDWRPAYLEKFEHTVHVTLHREFEIFDKSALVLVFSHQFERDRDILKRALLDGCEYIGLLSSPSRRDSIFAELRKEEISQSALERVSSPIGLDIGARSDPEIAVSIVAELIQFKNRSRSS